MYCLIYIDLRFLVTEGNDIKKSGGAHQEEFEAYKHIKFLVLWKNLLFFFFLKKKKENIWCFSVLTRFDNFLIISV